MRITQVIVGLYSGGAERLVVDLSNELSKENEVTLVTLKDLSKNGLDFYLSEVSSAVHHVNLGFSDGINFIYLWKVYKALKNSNPDIVHIHIVYPYCILAMLLMAFSHIKFYITIHNDVRLAYSKPSDRIIFNVCNRLLKLKFVAISQTNYDNFRLVYPNCKCRLIYNGRAVPAPSQRYNYVKKELAAYKTSSTTKILLHVGRCNEQKNQQVLIRSFDQIVKKGYDAILLIIGADFDNKLGVACKAIANDKVFFLGTRSNVMDYMYCSDAFCLSSIREGMPITLIEAMAASLPVISTPVCGIVDVVKDGDNGFLSKDFSVESYSSALCRYMKSDKVLEAGDKKYSNPYNIEHCSRLYIDYFNS